MTTSNLKERMETGYSLAWGVNESDLDKTSRPRNEAVEPREQRVSVVLCQTVSLSPSAHRSLSLQTFISSPFLFHLLLSTSVCHCSDYYTVAFTVCRPSFASSIHCSHWPVIARIVRNWQNKLRKQTALHVIIIYNKIYNTLNILT